MGLFDKIRKDIPVKGKIKLNECMVCGQKFESWKDEDGELETGICRDCDLKRFEGQIDDRERMG